MAKLKIITNHFFYFLLFPLDIKGVFLLIGQYIRPIYWFLYITTHDSPETGK